MLGSSFQDKINFGNVVLQLGLHIFRKDFLQLFNIYLSLGTAMTMTSLCLYTLYNRSSTNGYFHENGYL